MAEKNDQYHQRLSEMVGEQEDLLDELNCPTAHLVVRDQDSTALDHALRRNNARVRRVEAVLREKDEKLSQLTCNLAAAEREPLFEEISTYADDKRPVCSDFVQQRISRISHGDMGYP